MSLQTLAYVKTRFETGDAPSEQDFEDLIDSTADLSNATGNLPASQVFTDDTGESAQDKFDVLDIHIANTNNPHNTRSSNIPTTDTGTTIQDKLDELDSKSASDIPTNETGITIQDKLSLLESQIGSPKASNVTTDNTGISVQEELNSINAVLPKRHFVTISSVPDTDQEGWATIGTGGPYEAVLTHGLSASPDFAINVVTYIDGKNTGEKEEIKPTSVEIINSNSIRITHAENVDMYVFIHT